MSDDPDDRDLLAGSYALGVLDRTEAAEVEAAMATDPALRAAVAAWDARLAPLAGVVSPVLPPPELWSRIVASAGLGVVVPPRETLLRRTWRSTPFWRTTTVAAMAIAAAFAAIAFLHEQSPAERLVAALAPPGAPAAVFMAEVQPDGRVLIRPLGPVSVQAGKDLELWALPAGATRPCRWGVAADRAQSARTRVAGGTHAVDDQLGAAGRVADRVTDRPGAVGRPAGAGAVGRGRAKSEAPSAACLLCATSEVERPARAAEGASLFRPTFMLRYAWPAASDSCSGSTFSLAKARRHFVSWPESNTSVSSAGTDSQAFCWISLSSWPGPQPA